MPLQDEHSQRHQDRRQEEDELPEVLGRQGALPFPPSSSAPPSNWPSNSRPPMPIQARPQPIISPSPNDSEERA